MAEKRESPTASTDNASRMGGLALYKKHGADHMRRIGEKGRATVQEKYGLRFYSEIARRKRRRLEVETDVAVRVG